MRARLRYARPMGTNPTEPAGALATRSATAPRPLIDNPAELDDAQLLELLKGFHARTTVVGGAAAAVTAALAVALTPVVWFASLALIPAGIAGFTLANRVVWHGAAARSGITPRCLREVEKAFDLATIRMDLRSLRARDWVRTDYERMLPIVRAELARG